MPPKICTYWFINNACYQFSISCFVLLHVTFNYIDFGCQVHLSPNGGDAKVVRSTLQSTWLNRTWLRATVTLEELWRWGKHEDQSEWQSNMQNHDEFSMNLKPQGIHSNLEITILEIWNSGHKNQICYVETMGWDMSPCFTMFDHLSMFISFRIFRQSRWHMVTRLAGCTTLWRQGGWIGYHITSTSVYDKHVWNLTGRIPEKEFLKNIDVKPSLSGEFSGLYDWKCF